MPRAISHRFCHVCASDADSRRLHSADRNFVEATKKNKRQGWAIMCTIRAELTFLLPCFHREKAETMSDYIANVDV